MPVIARNRQASFNYELQEKYEAGLVLKGHEAKSVKTGHISLKGSFVTKNGNELFLTNAFIPPYKFSGEIKNYNPIRPRKLLLKKSEIKFIIGKISTEGLTLVPLCVYTKRKLLKLEFAIAKGKKKFDKRNAIKKRDDKRRMEKMIKHF